MKCSISPLSMSIGGSTYHHYKSVDNVGFYNQKERKCYAILIYIAEADESGKVVSFMDFYEMVDFIVRSGESMTTKGVGS